MPIDKAPLSALFFIDKKCEIACILSIVLLLFARCEKRSELEIFMNNTDHPPSMKGEK